MNGSLRWRRRGQGGFSLLELLIVMVISGLALLLATGLLLEAQSRMAHESKRQVDPVGQLAAEQLQADVRMAEGVERPLVSGWLSREMVLLGHPAGRVSYLQEGGQLLRRVQRQRRDGTMAEGERLVLDRLTTFRWRPLSDGSLDVEMGFHRSGRLRGLHAGGNWSGDVLIGETRRLRIVPRGGGGARW